MPEMRRSRFLLVTAITMAMWLAAPRGAERGQFSPDEMKAWLTYIASDSLQGRQLFTEGLGLAGAYIAEHLKAWGVSPAGDAGSYFQTVKILGMRVRSNSSITRAASRRLPPPSNSWATGFNSHR